MIAKDKMFVVAGNIDDSIKAVTPVYDISLFSNFMQFEEYMNNTPMSLGSIIITDKELPFTNTNISRLLDILDSPFLKLSGQVIYLISNDSLKDVVQSFLDSIDDSRIVCYQGDLSPGFISDIISGAARIADESETEIVTYRMRASEYINHKKVQRYESDDTTPYVTDENDLEGIPNIEEPDLIIPTIDVVTSCYYVVGKPSLKRTLFAFIEAQYLSLKGKTIIIECDSNYHTLTDMVTKSSVKYEYFDIGDFIYNCSKVLRDIKESPSKLIVLGAVSRVVYNYDFIYDLLLSNLEGHIDYFIKECNYIQTPHSSYYNVVCGNTVPEVIECVNSLKYEVDVNKVIFVGVMTEDLGELNITSQEMADIIQVLLDTPRVVGQVVKVNGINLKGDGIVYDVFSVIGRGNERQS